MRISDWSSDVCSSDLSDARVEGYRNFATKLWNAARFCEMNGCTPKPDFDPLAFEQTVNRWIVGKTAETGRQVTAALEAYRFNEAAAALYQFTWGTFCDWYHRSEERRGGKASVRE